MIYLRFGIRDLLWAMALIGMGLGWWLDRSLLVGRVDSIAQKWRVAAFRFDEASNVLEKNGYAVETTEHDGGDSIVIKRDPGPSSSAYIGKDSGWRPPE
jgi:hypothetical protein